MIFTVPLMTTNDIRYHWWQPMIYGTIDGNQWYLRYHWWQPMIYGTIDDNQWYMVQLMTTNDIRYHWWLWYNYDLPVVYRRASRKMRPHFQVILLIVVCVMFLFYDIHNNQLMWHLSVKAKNKKCVSFLRVHNNACGLLHS